MDRKKFLAKGLIGLATIVALPGAITSCKKEDTPLSSGPGGPGSPEDNEPWDGSGDCPVSPRETEGPYPIKTPAQLVMENIIGDRTGVALLMTITINDQSNDCAPLPGVLVDVWQCDKDGNYSQYGDYTGASFLRGRQTTDGNGQVSFISIFPGWYSGRAPHIHIEVLDTNENSLLVSQIAFPADIYTEVYATSGYNGAPDTSNDSDGIFANSIEGNICDSITGNTTDGYTLLKTIIVE